MVQPIETPCWANHLRSFKPNVWPRQLVGPEVLIDDDHADRVAKDAANSPTLLSEQSSNFTAKPFLLVTGNAVTSGATMLAD